MVYALISDRKLDGKPVAGFQPKNEDYLKIEVEDATPDGGLHFNYGRQFNSGRRIKIDHAPKQMKLDGGSVIADYTSYNGFFCVTDKFKAIVENIEPDVHQFIPFEAVGLSNRHVAELWIMVVCNRIDSVDRDLTTMILDGGTMWVNHRDIPSNEWPDGFNPNLSHRLTFNLDQIGNNHLWFDKHLSSNVPFASDSIVAALKNADITGVSFSKREAV